MSAHIKRMAKVIAAAEKYRKGQVFPAGGFVILWRMKGTGWACDLSDPRRFRPGALAVGDAEQVFQATGGNYWDGADAWSSIFAPLPAAPIE